MASNVTALINNQPVSPLINTLAAHDSYDGSSTLTFNIKDSTGLVKYKTGTPVSLTDSASGYVFSGYVHDDQRIPLPPSSTQNITVNCVDGHYIPGKRYYAGPEWTNAYAGDIATDLLGNTLGLEGINDAYATLKAKDVSSWQSGSLSNTVGTSGALALSPAGTTVNFLQQTQADFNAGVTGGGLTATNNGVTFTPTPGIMLQATESLPGLTNAYTYVKIWDKSLGAYTIPSSNPTLFYDIWIADSCPQQMAGVDIVFTDGTTLRDSALVQADQQGVGAHPKNDLSGLATNQWYSRVLPLYGSGSLAGKSVAYVSVAFEGDKQGTYTAYFRNVKISNADGSSPLNVFTSSATAIAITPQQLQNAGYSAMSCTFQTTYERHGSMRSPAFSMSNAGICGGSNIDWSIVFPTVNTSKFTFIVTASIDGTATYLPCTQNNPIPGLLPGMSLSGKSVTVHYVFDNATNDPTQTPVLNWVEGAIQPAYQTTKSDSITVYNSQANWNTGTLTNLTAPGGATLQPNGACRNYDDSNFGSQTLYGTGSPGQSVITNQFVLTCNTSGETRSRLDFAGQFADATMEYDVLLDNANVKYGNVYRTTGWVNTDGSYAYNVEITTTSLKLFKGTNGGANSITQIGSTVTFTLSSGNLHRIKVSFVGSAHKIYMDDVLLLSATDGTYTTAGYVGLRQSNSSGSSYNATFDNFGIITYNSSGSNPLAGTWVSPAIDIHALGTISNSQLLLQIDPANNASLTTYLVEISLNNGSTYTTCPNIQTTPLYYYAYQLPGLTPGTNVASLTQVKLRITISPSTAATGATMPDVTAINLTVLGAYSASGTWISTALSLANVGRVGSTLIDWSGTQPTNTLISVDTTINGGVTWSNVGTGAVNSGAIAGIFTGASPVVDKFSTNNIANYIQTYQTGGSLATLTWNTASNQLSMSGGLHSQLLYASPITGADTDVGAILDTADNAGFVWRWQDQSNLYELHIHDASSSTNANTARLNIVSANVQTLLTFANISFTRGTPHAFRVQHIGSAITVTMDGVTIISWIDNTISAAGFAGMTNNGTIAKFYLFRLQFLGQDVTALTASSRVTLTSTDPTQTPVVATLTLSCRDANIQNGALIPQTQYSILSGNDKYESAILDDLVKQSGNFWWKVNFIPGTGYRLVFQQHQATPAPWPITANDVQINNFNIADTNDQYRNVTWEKNGYDTLNLAPELFVGDGTTTTFNVGYPIDSINSISINGVSQTFGLKGVNTGDNWYYTQGSTQLVQDTSGVPLLTTQSMSVNYNAQVSITSEIDNASEIARMKALDQTTGIIEASDDAKGLTKTALLTRGMGINQQYSQPTQILTFDTLRSGLQVGQLAAVFNVMGIFAGVFVITDVQAIWKPTVINGVRSESAWFSVVASDGAKPQDWARFMTSNMMQG